jgi:hypothetical protein
MTGIRGAPKVGSGLGGQKGTDTSKLSSGASAEGPSQLEPLSANHVSANCRNADDCWKLRQTPPYRADSQ